jgi:dynactin 1
MSGVAESMEMATLDKEMAEERADMLQVELDAAKERIEELEIDLNILKEQVDSASSAAPVMTTTDISADAPVQVKQLTLQNERLKDALVK